MRRYLAVAAAILIALSSAAYAGPRQQIITCDERGCSDSRGASVGRSGGSLAGAPTNLGGGRPAGCPALWCGCWARLDAGLTDTRFNLVANWPRYLTVVAGRGAEPVVGSYAIMGRRGGGHVGRVIGVDGDGNPILRSGNHNGQVADAVYPKGRILAYVRP